MKVDILFTPNNCNVTTWLLLILLVHGCMFVTAPRKEACMNPHKALRLADGQVRILAVGRRVRVFNGHNRPIFGTYMGQVRMREIDRNSGPVIANFTTPKIRLDSGEVIYGISCWWNTRLFSFSPE